MSILSADTFNAIENVYDLYNFTKQILLRVLNKFLKIFDKRSGSKVFTNKQKHKSIIGPLDPFIISLDELKRKILLAAPSPQVRPTPTMY